MSYHLVSRSVVRPPLRRQAGNGLALPSSTPRAAGGTSADRHLLWQVLLCVVPTVLVFVLVGPRLAARCFWGLLGAFSLGLVLSRRSGELLRLLIAVTPWISLIRDFAFYNIVTVLFGGALFFHYLLRPGEVAGVLRRLPYAWALLVVPPLFYATSLFMTRDYASNLRVMEFAGVLLSVIVVGSHPRRLQAPLLGLLLSAVGVGLAMFNYSAASIGRLGMATLEDQSVESIGNPVQLGAPLALGVLALSVDRAQWLGLKQTPALRYGLLLVVASLLALTTSRAAWLVVACGFLAVLLIGQRQRRFLFVPLAAAALVCTILLQSDFGSGFQKGVARTFDTDRNFNSATSGRSDQWAVALTAFTSSPLSVLAGHGPGTSPDMYARFSLLTKDVSYGAGRRRAFHSLFMLIIVETGLLGLVPLLLWLGVIGARLLRWTLRSGFTFPLTCFFGYLCTAMTVPGFDPGCGIYLGIALTACLRPPLSRNHRLRPARYPGLAAPSRFRSPGLMKWPSNVTRWNPAKLVKPPAPRVS